MCGINGRIGILNEATNTLEILEALESRGYDSQGIVRKTIGGKTYLEKTIGTFNDKGLKEHPSVKSNIELAHTRWATHGGILKINAHPHSDLEDRIYVVANGIIENEQELRDNLTAQGYKFKSETDSEIIPAMYNLKLKGGETNLQLVKITRQILSTLEGEFSFVANYENKIISYRNSNPIAIGKNNNETFICSQPNLLDGFVVDYIILGKDDIAISTLTDKVKTIVYDKKGKIITKKKIEANNKKIKLKDTTYCSHLEREIYEQDMIYTLLSLENIEKISKISKMLKNKKPIFITGAGSSQYNSEYLQAKLLETNTLSQVINASELMNYAPHIEDHKILVFSQSGETGDLLEPLRILNKKNKIIAITNTPNSSIDRLSDQSIYLNAGVEQSVATTKAFTHSMLFAHLLQNAIETKIKQGINHIHNLPNEFKETIDKNKSTLTEIINEFNKSKDFFFIGRDKYVPLAKEGALKLKEISYIHAEGLPAGELKHGTLALIENGTPCVALDSNPQTITNAKEIKTRGGKIIGISDKNNEVYDYFLEVPNMPFKKEFLSVVLMQLLALKMTEKLKINPDKPRNLAKSVTVK